MARGFLAGALWGGVLSIGVAGVASVMSPLPQSPLVGALAPGETLAPDAVAPDGQTAELSDTVGASNPAQDTAPAVADAPQATAPVRDTLSSLDSDTLSSAAAPQTGQADNLAAPAAVLDNGSAAPQSEDPVFPNPQALAPMEPQAADSLSISTEPAQPPQPAPEPVQSAFETAPDPEPESGQAVAQEGAAVATEQTDAGADADRAATEPAPDNAAAQDTELAALPSPETPPAAATPEVADAERTEDDGNRADDGILAMPAPAEGPQIGTPAVPLTERDTGVAVNRLAPSAAPAAAEQQSSGEAAQGDTRPITVFAEPFENSENKPLMSIVLIDNGSSPTSGAAGLAALRSFPYPISFAVDSSMPDAAERMTLFREKGFEVLAMIDLPEGAEPSDAETTLGAILPQLSDVVGVLEGAGGGLQGSREVGDQVTAILAQTGHGLVTQDKGLNTMPKLARKEGVPATPIFRDFDSKGQNAVVIRRFLDQAAFKAGQEGAVIMLGRLRPDTISALLLWGLQDRAGQVALAPVSAVLKRDTE
ncbi:MAG: divergent polysaccharide deacetylase family protein [Sulfitobacter sp.]|jgi:polysaccharide deacetylase 2 family uncharacterized protein YibQ|nr:divergent polysaccharide deacetylase family protein [Sulfitobacter sp.]